MGKKEELLETVKLLESKCVVIDDKIKRLNEKKESCKQRAAALLQEVDDLNKKEKDEEEKA